MAILADVILLEGRWVIGTDIGENEFKLDLWTGISGTEELGKFNDLSKDQQQVFLSAYGYFPTVEEHIRFAQKTLESDFKEAFGEAYHVDT